MWLAICELIISEICATDTPSIAGPMRDRILLTPGWAQARPSRAGLSAMRGSMPMRSSAGT